ncbi:hypothetical protein [Niallia sp. Krafla_26]|uniref:hypothetical protein n=1 Tax=Niallia sp. Krafla_26 TaxID=3064703 RepID=UPI003D165BDB
MESKSDNKKKKTSFFTKLGNDVDRIENEHPKRIELLLLCFFVIFTALIVSIHHIPIYYGPFEPVWLYNLLLSLVITDSFLGNITSIMFGVTSGILSLMGLVAIFVSLNSQHKIQKCREIYWEIIEIQGNYDLNIYEISEKMTNKIWLYSKVFNSEEKFIKYVIWVSQFTIVLVILLWSLIVAFIDGTYLENTLIWISYISGTIILLLFFNILGKLKRGTHIGELPEVNDILDISKEGEHGIRSIFLAVNNFEFYARLLWEYSDVLQYQPYDLEYEIGVDTRLPLSGFRLYIEEIKESEEGFLLSEIYEDELYIDLPSKGNEKNVTEWINKNSVNESYVIKELTESVDYDEWGELGDIKTIPSKLPEKLIITCVLTPINNLPVLKKSYFSKDYKSFSVYNDKQILKLKFTVYVDEIRGNSYFSSLTDIVEYDIRGRIQKDRRKYKTKWDELNEEEYKNSDIFTGVY